MVPFRHVNFGEGYPPRLLTAAALWRDVLRGLQVIYLTGKVKGKFTAQTETRLSALASQAIFWVASGITTTGNLERFGSKQIMFYRKFLLASMSMIVLGLALSLAQGQVTRNQNKKGGLESVEPLNIAVLIQDDVISQVSNEIGVTRDFIQSLPRGSRVMVGYITAGSLQVRQPFTTDLDKAARSLRIPISSISSAPYNPYVEVIEALKKFQSNWQNDNAVLLISDGLDTSRGFDSTVAGHTVDLERSIAEANRRKISVFTFYAPSVGLTSYSRLAASYGQSSLNRLADETGGEAFFQGTTGFVTFDSYFTRLRAALNRQYAKAR